MADEFKCPNCRRSEVRFRVALDFSVGPRFTHGGKPAGIGADFDETAEPATWSFYCAEMACQYKLEEDEVPKTYFEELNKLLELGEARMNLKSEEGW